MKRLSLAARVLIPTVMLVPFCACNNCHYGVGPTGSPVSAAGGAVPVLVTTGSTCTWTYQGNAPWITVGPDPDSTGQTGQGNGRVLVTAAQNTGTARRTGTATVAGQAITIDQAGTGGSGCTFQVSPPDSTFTGGAAGTGQFKITASSPDCGWRASRNAVLEDTVNLTAGGRGGSPEERFGVGSSTIEYQVKAKSGTSPWPAGGGDIVVRDSAQQVAATHHLNLQ